MANVKNVPYMYDEKTDEVMLPADGAEPDQAEVRGPGYLCHCLACEAVH